jgi:squalene-hopene/tetraprenyl-beta-curcumene cyclase
VVHKQARFIVAATALLSLFSCLCAQAGEDAKPPAAADIRKAVERSLPYIQKEGTAWIADRKCVSCHVVPFMLWSLNEAGARHIAVDAKKLNQWADWSLDYSLSLRQWYKLTDDSVKKLGEQAPPEAVMSRLKPLMNKGFVSEEEFDGKLGEALTAEDLDKHKALLVKTATQGKSGGQNDAGSMEAMAQLILGRSLDKNPKMDAYLEAAPAQIRKWQESDGSWKAGGQLPSQNWPRAEADETTTGWMILALAALDSKDPVAAKAQGDGLAFFKKTKPGKTQENLLVHLLVEDKLGKPEDTASLLQDVLKRQNQDGGWAWLAGGASDAFATGQTLYALSILKTKVEPDALGKAQKFLLDSQNKDGFWSVPPKAITNPKTSDDRVKKLVPIYQFWGTAWAAIGLSRSLN